MLFNLSEPVSSSVEWRQCYLLRGVECPHSTCWMGLWEISSLPAYICLCAGMCLWPVSLIGWKYTGLWLFWALANNNTIIPSIQLLTPETTCHMELFGLWEPPGLGALQTSISLRSCDSHRPRKEGHRMTRQEGINPILSQLSPASSGQETVPKRKGVWQREGPWYCRDSVEGLEHKHSTQESVLRGSSGVKFLVMGHVEGSWRSQVNLPEN